MQSVRGRQSSVFDRCPWNPWRLFRPGPGLLRTCGQHHGLDHTLHLRRIPQHCHGHSLAGSPQIKGSVRLLQNAVGNCPGTNGYDYSLQVVNFHEIGLCELKRNPNIKQITKTAVEFCYHNLTISADCRLDVIRYQLKINSTLE